MRLKVNGISFAYNGTKALDGVEFEANAGEVVGIIGPNGSGKTTMLKCINRVLKPKEGAVLIDDRDVADWSRKDIAQEIGVVPQNNSINFPFSVLDIVMMGRTASIDRFKKESESDLEICKKAMELTDITHLAGRSINEISGGERQRVIIARALAQRPKILLLDEPTLHLDINHQLDVMSLVRRLAKEQELVVVLVSHDLSVAVRYCDRIILLKKGVIQSVGSSIDVLTPENLADVFRVRAEVYWDERIGSHNVVIIGNLGQN